MEYSCGARFTRMFAMEMDQFLLGAGHIISDERPNHALQRTEAGRRREENMKAPEHFEIMESHCCYRLSGHGALEEAAGKVIEVLTFAREQGLRKMLIDTTGWTGHASPGTFERFRVAEAFTKAAGSALKVAMVVRPEMMDPEKFEVVVATNRGLNGNVFDSEPEALAWLLGPKA